MTPYVAPELFDCKTQLPPFSKKTDIYSLGILLWELSSGYPPFKDHDTNDRTCRGILIHLITNGKREERMSDTPSDYYELYTACWNGNPEERPIIEDVHDKLKNMLFKNDEIAIKIKDTEVDTEGISLIWHYIFLLFL